MKLTKQQLKQIVEEELATLTDGIMDTEEEKARKQHMRRMKRHPQTKLDKQLRDRELKRRIDREFEEPSESEHDGYGGTRRAVGWSEGKLTKQQLEEIVSEELSSVMSEVGLEHDPTGEDAPPYKPAPFRPDPFSDEGKDLARKTPTYVEGPARIFSDRGEGRIQHLTTVEDGEGVFIKFDEEQ